MTTVLDRARDIVAPVVEELGLDLFDLEHRGGTLRVIVDRSGGVDLEAIAEATRRVSRALDLEDPIPGRYTLEVTSPGVERPLRTPAHFQWAVGKQVALKILPVPGSDSDRRISGTLMTAAEEASGAIEILDEEGSLRSVSYGEIDRARTVFEWGGAGKPVTRRPKGTKSESPVGVGGSGHERTQARGKQSS